MVSVTGTEERFTNITQATIISQLHRKTRNLVQQLPVKKLRSIPGQRTSRGCLSLVCGIEGGTGWACSEDTLCVGGSAACCGYFENFEMRAQRSGSGSYRGRWDLAGAESFGGPQR